MARFEEDHAVEMVRGMKRPQRGKILKELATRSSWLSQKIASRVKMHGPQSGNTPHVRELICMVRAAEIIEEERKKGNPVSDFSRFRDLVVGVMEGPKAKKEAALDELIGDLANVEVLVRALVFQVITTGELQKHYDAVWKD